MQSFVTRNEPPFRPGTEIEKTHVALVFNSGGIGDYINWVPAIRHAVETNPHINGFIVSPPWFFDLASLWLSDLAPRFRLLMSEQWEKEGLIRKFPTIAPQRNQFANATGFSLRQLGFIYYSQIDYVPKGYEHPPLIRGDEADVSAFGLPERYAVVTPWATHENRRLTPEAVNELTAHLLSEGTTPVFLGRAFLAHDHQMERPSGLSLDGVIDLSDRTSLREAAVILSGARAVIGLDNGLLHLAACSGVPLVFAFTTVDPRLRMPLRRDGARTVVLTPPKELACRFCTQIRYLIGHDFKNCMYRDNLCTKFITGPELIRAYKELHK